MRPEFTDDLILVRHHPKSDWQEYAPHFSEVVEMMAERYKHLHVDSPPIEIIEVRVSSRAFVAARVVVDTVAPLGNDGDVAT